MQVFNDQVRWSWRLSWACPCSLAWLSCHCGGAPCLCVQHLGLPRPWQAPHPILSCGAAMQAEQLLGMKADELAEIRESGACRVDVKVCKLAEPYRTHRLAASACYGELRIVSVSMQEPHPAAPPCCRPCAACRCQALPGRAQVGPVAGQRAAPQGAGTGAVCAASAKRGQGQFVSCMLGPPWWLAMDITGPLFKHLACPLLACRSTTARRGSGMRCRTSAQLTMPPSAAACCCSSARQHELPSHGRQC